MTRPDLRNDLEIDSIYVDLHDRYVVSLVATYDDDPETGGVNSPEEAIAYALDLTRDLGSMSTTWYVFDRKTQRGRFIEQGDIPQIPSIRITPGEWT